LSCLFDADGVDNMQSIRLASSTTFYRRMRTLFFSNPSEQEYEGFFKKGSRRRRTTTDSNKNSISSASTSSSTSVIGSVISGSCAQGHNTNEIQVRRATTKPYPEEASIYVIDNFLTEAELEYFDKKIATIPFERSFVDNTECYDDEDDDYDDTCDDDTCTGDDESADNDKEIQVNCDGDVGRNGNEGKEKIDTCNTVKEQKVSGVDDNTSSSAISTSPCNNGKAEYANNEVGTTTNKNGNNDSGRNCYGNGNEGKEKNDTVNIVKEQKVSGVYNNTNSASAISTGTCNNGKEDDVNNEVGTRTTNKNYKNDNNDKHKNNKRKKRKKNGKPQPATLVDDSHRTSTFYSFKKLHDSKISSLERRICDMLVSYFFEIYGRHGVFVS
jgi:hypothetical protein